MNPPLPNNFDPAVLDAILTVDLSSVLFGGDSHGHRPCVQVARNALLYIYRTQGVPTTRYIQAAILGISYGHMSNLYLRLSRLGLVTHKFSGNMKYRSRMHTVCLNTDKLMSLPRLTWNEIEARCQKMSELKTRHSQTHKARKKLNAKPVTSSLCACQ